MEFRTQMRLSVPVPDAWLEELEGAFGPAKRRGKVTIPKNSCKLAGFPIDSLVLAVVDELRIQRPVEVHFDQKTTPQAELNRFPYGPLEIHLPTRRTIKRLMPELSEREVTAKMVSQVAEEACFVPGTVILTDTRAKLIEDVVEGDRLYKKSSIATAGTNITGSTTQRAYLHSGFSSFKTKSVRQYDGHLIVIKPSHALPIRCTPNHPFWVKHSLAGGDKWGWVQAQDIREGDYFKFSFGNLFKTECPLPALPAIRNRQGRVETQLTWTPDIARFLGYFLAEGCTVKRTTGRRAPQTRHYPRRKVQLSLGAHEADFIEDVLRIVRTSFHRKAWITKAKKTNGVAVIFACADLAEYLHNSFGTPAKRKTFPMEYLSLPAPLLREFLFGFQRGDGHVIKGTETRSPRVMLTTASKGLAVMLQLALLRLGLVSIVGSSSAKGVRIKGRAPSGKLHTWYLVCYNINQRTRHWARKGKTTIRLRAYDNNLISRVMSVGLEEYHGPVYNFEMKGLPNYAVYPAFAHNCHYHAHNDCHDKRVVGCTLRLMRKHIAKRDLKTPYIAEKTAILKASPKSPDRCPLR